MTLGEAKEQVLRLLDEYGGGDTELEERIGGLIDLGQKRLAGIQKTVKAVELDCTQTEWELPEDALGFYRLWVNGRQVRTPRRIGGKLVLPAGAKSAVLEYFRLPARVDDTTEDTAELELSESAAACLPYLVAGELLCADMVQDGSALLAIYERMAAELDRTLPGEGRVVNGFFGGRR
ncbi:MAG: hypothetical protein MJ074_03825 [Oscillospiraceae bacterium]|nr:hypothetical protein [Oscillospiraceae bacterium]